MSTGIRAIALDTYAASEMRAPAVGGGAEAWRVLAAETSAFCQSQGRVWVPVSMIPGGDRTTPYYPTSFNAVFRCAPPSKSGG